MLGRVPWASYAAEFLLKVWTCVYEQIASAGSHVDGGHPNGKDVLAGNECGGGSGIQV